MKIFIGKSKRRCKVAEELYTTAKELGLPCALGRALYLANRHFNGDFKPWGGLSRADDSARNRLHGTEFSDDHRTLRSVQLSTAKRWLAHWKNGGSLKSLKYSQDEWLAMRRASAPRGVARTPALAPGPRCM